MLKLFKKEKLEKPNQGLLINAFYKDDKLYTTIKVEDKKQNFIVDYFPYFYLVTRSSLTPEQEKETITTLGLKELIFVKKENTPFSYKCVFHTVGDLISTQKKMFSLDLSLDFVHKIYEYDIPFVYRFFLDHHLSNFRNVVFELNDNNEIISIEDRGKAPLTEVKTACFDIEVLVPSSLAFPTPGKDKIISIAYLDNEKNKTVFFLGDEISEEQKQKHSSNFSNTTINFYTSELDLIKSFLEFVGEEDPDIIYTYNGTFDFEYLFKTYDSYTKKELKFGTSSLVYHRYPNKRYSLETMLHIDVYTILRQLNYLQVFNHPRLSLDIIYPILTNAPKKTLSAEDMRKAYLDKDYSKIIEYNIDDVEATFILGENYQDLVLEMADYLDAPVRDVLYSAAGSLVEKQFIKYFSEAKLIIPNKPSSQQIFERSKFSFSGAYVKQPIAGIHNNIAVLDFRSYHISILMSYNISPETLNCKCCKDLPLSEKTTILGNYICKNKKGFVPIIVNELLTQRMNAKEEMINYPKESKEYKSLYAKQYAQKILLASTYGYMGFAGSRWYSREVLQIMYHLVRLKIQEVISDFENLGYLVLYGDTDSCFIQFKDLDKLKQDVNKISDSLPKEMHLELEEIYMSGIFVRARSGGKVAKKRYALLDFNENLKIVGFEYVRHDWSLLVKESQKEVLKLILKEQDPKKAVVFIRNTIEDLRNKEVPISKLIIQTFLRKPIASYKSMNPVVSAVISAKKEDIDIKPGSLVDYVITDGEGTISQKSKLAELVEEKDYDADYYVNNQLLPAILPILEAFDVTKDELLTSTKQKGISEFF